MSNNSAKQQRPLKNNKPLLQSQQQTNQMKTKQERRILEPESLIKPLTSEKAKRAR